MKRHLRRAVHAYEEALRCSTRRRVQFVSALLSDDPDACDLALAMLRHSAGNGELPCHNQAEYPDSVPATFERYRVVQQFARTAYFNLYLGIPDDDPHPVMIKAVRPDADPDEAMEQFTREFAARLVLHAKGFGDTYVIPMLNVALEAPQYFTMPLVVGWVFEEFAKGPADLPDFIHRGSNVIPYLTLCQAIERIHRAGIVHADLSPHNIIVDRDNCVSHVFDFGVAYVPRCAAISTMIDMELPALPRGTSVYVAPERLHDEQAIACPAWDIYSLGVLGRELFSYQCGRNKALNEVFHKAHAADPEARYRTVEELTQAFFDTTVNWEEGRRVSLPSDVPTSYRPTWRRLFDKWCELWMRYGWVAIIAFFIFAILAWCGILK